MTAPEPAPESRATPAAPAAPAAPSALPGPPRRSAWPTVLLCLAIFVAGGVVGWGVTVIHVYRETLAALQHPEQLPDRVARRLQKRLDLTDEQALAVEAILRRRQGTLMEARAELMQRTGPQLDAMEDEIAAVMQPGQALRFREQFRRLRGLWLAGGRLSLPDR